MGWKLSNRSLILKIASIAGIETIVFIQLKSWLATPAHIRFGIYISPES